MTTEHTFRQPPMATRADGQMRQVGIELEFSGLSLDQAAQCVQASIGGEIVTHSAATRVVGTADRQFTVTIDWEYLIRRSAEQAQNQAETGNEDHWLESLSEAATLLVPIEVVSPPIPLSELPQIDAVIETLRAAGALGTRKSVLAAYGLHINIEPPALDAATLDAYLQAFGLLQWWLMQAHRVDTTRRLSPYIALYPERYVVELLERKTSSLEALTDHYLEHNASRNRALDMLPLLAEFDAPRVSAAVNDPRIKSRPALHYRLPNCEIAQPDWSVSEAWNLWCVVERLASDVDARQELAAHLQARLRPLIGLDQGSWTKQTDTWLQEREWV